MNEDLNDQLLIRQMVERWAVPMLQSSRSWLGVSRTSSL